MSNLNFESILSAIDILLDKKLADVPYSSRAEGTVIEKLSSGKYRVEYDGGEVDAIDLNPNTSHEVGEGVQLLISNGTQNGVETCILGSTTTATDDDISYIFKTLNLEFITDNLIDVGNQSIQVQVTSSETTNCIKTIDESDKLNIINTVFKNTGRFIFCVKIKTNLTGSNIIKGDYGFVFSYKKSDSTKSVLVDSKYLVGDPKKYLVDTEQTVSFIIPKEDRKDIDNDAITEVQLGIYTKNFPKVLETEKIYLSDMSFFGASDPEEIKDSKLVISAVNPNAASFVTDGGNVLLKAFLEYNERTYEPFGATYYWERLDSPTLDRENWKTLNTVVEKEYDGIKYSEEIGRVSNEISLSKDNAQYFENYYRCKIKYAGFTKVSDAFKVINYEKPDFSVFYSLANKKDTLFKSDDSIKATVSAKLLKEASGYSFTYSWYKKTGDSYVVISESSTNRELTITYDSTSPIGENFYKCVVNIKYGDTIVGQKEVEIKVFNYVLGEDVQTTELVETIYYNAGNTKPPAKPDFEAYPSSESDWKISKPENSNFLFSSERRVFVSIDADGNYKWIGYGEGNVPGTQKYSSATITINNKNITYYVVNGAGTYIKDPNIAANPTAWSEPKCIEVSGGDPELANQVNIFNQLTQNGTEDGFYWNNSGVQKYEETADATPVGGKVYYTKSGENYTKLEGLTSFDSSKTYYEYIRSHLFINATYVKSKTLEVPGKFYASVYRDRVSIGGWEVDDYKLYSYVIENTNRPNYILGTGIASTANPNDPAFWAGYSGYVGNGTNDTSPWTNSGEESWSDKTAFYVTNTGYMKAVSGNIAGFEINENSFFSGFDNASWGEDGTVLVSRGTTSVKNIAGSGEISGWCFVAGNDFGVTANGNLYARKATFTGDVSILDKSNNITFQANMKGVNCPSIYCNAVVNKENSSVCVKFGEPENVTSYTTKYYTVYLRREDIDNKARISIAFYDIDENAFLLDDFNITLQANYSNNTSLTYNWTIPKNYKIGQHNYSSAGGGSVSQDTNWGVLGDVALENNKFWQGKGSLQTFQLKDINLFSDDGSSTSVSSSNFSLANKDFKTIISSTGKNALLSGRLKTILINAKDLIYTVTFQNQSLVPMGFSSFGTTKRPWNCYVSKMYVYNSDNQKFYEGATQYELTIDGNEYNFVNGIFCGKTIES